jgi:hypothetical protein
MLRIKLVVAVVGIAVMAVTLLCSSALARVRVFPSFREWNTGRALEPGTPLQLKASDVLITTTDGNITCEDGRLNATLQNNGLHSDGFVVNAAVFHNSKNEPCPSTTPMGPATITTEPPHGGWPGRAKTNGKADVVGPLVLTVVFESSGVAVTCTWSDTKVRATFIPNATPIEVRVSNAKFKRVGTLATCPKRAFLSADFNLTTPEPGTSKQTPVSMS